MQPQASPTCAQASTTPQPVPQPPAIPACFTDFATKRYHSMVEASKAKHTVWFHRCCFTFSSSKKRHCLGHPASHGGPLLTFLDEHSIVSAEGFAALMHKMAVARGDGQPPTYNQHHQDQPCLNKRQTSPTEPDQPSEVEVLRQELAALRNRVNTLEEGQRLLQEELQAERKAALLNEEEYLAMVHTNRVMARLMAYQGIKVPFDGLLALGSRLAQNFQNANPYMLTFTNIPRPHLPFLPSPGPPVALTYDELQKLFYQARDDADEKMLRK